jgi:hypothetical protein
MGSRIALFEQIRRDRDREDLSIRGLAVRHGLAGFAAGFGVAGVGREAGAIRRPAPTLGQYGGWSASG